MNLSELLKDKKSIRDVVIEQLGGVCTRCKWGEVKSALWISGSAGTEMRKGKNREKYYLEVLGSLGDQEWELVCPNCRAIEFVKDRVTVKKNVAPAVQSALTVAPEVWLWTTDIEYSRDMELGWAEDKLAEGARFYVWVTSDLRSGRVYNYVNKNDTGVSIDEWKTQMGIEKLKVSIGSTERVL